MLFFWLQKGSYSFNHTQNNNHSQWEAKMRKPALSVDITLINWVTLKHDIIAVAVMLQLLAEAIYWTNSKSSSSSKVWFIYTPKYLNLFPVLKIPEIPLEWLSSIKRTTNQFSLLRCNWSFGHCRESARLLKLFHIEMFNKISKLKKIKTKKNLWNKY